MKDVFWKSVLVISVFTMVLGFLISAYGVYSHDELFVYSGIVLIGITCMSWWIWVMIVIKSMWDFTQNTRNRVVDIRESIREVKDIFNEYKNLTRR
jgi:type VI protein secretion system component VasK